MESRFVVAEEEVGERLDAFLAARLNGPSRATLQRAIAQQAVTVNQVARRSSYRLRQGDVIEVSEWQEVADGPRPEPIPLKILHEDRHIVVVDKPTGMIVHPAKGHWSGTLSSALAYHVGAMSNLGGETRPGIVHRLDRDTSGVIVTARTNRAHANLAAQFADRSVQKEYFAIVHGRPDRDQDEIDAPIGPHPKFRERKAVDRHHPQARTATTFYQVDSRYEKSTTVRLFPRTGRTHQLRVHLAHIGHPILCDPLYGRGEPIRLDTPDHLPATTLARLALHAWSLAINHPNSGERMTFRAPIPDDISQFVAHLQASSDLRKKT